ncbi:cupin domain-containing protein [Wenzhouxiangella sp. XN79A]|uniref:1,2-dihydroxy-3-keto-5-methylthiopentene dioxygenase n=1 Tax=Wenzhouxiangella sp. XN79A TaxID=2724193 RepID=UPI00144A5C29|nr:cupin domain-containing protein [Wenzhouxiangella sp. XN79A]NKI34529.1 cupin domain-containing protein [Wenzhouxiangella sp. XN79A]
MTQLTVYRMPADGSGHGEVESTTRAYDEIADRLGSIGVRFARWPLAGELPADADGDAVLERYQEPLQALCDEGGYRSMDVVRMWPDHPQREAARQKFLQEHTHAEDEVRFFVEGSGLFSLHVGDRVHEILCEAGDLIGVPAGTPHWFDMGEAPRFTAIRLFTNPDGWVASFTGSDVADRFPRFDEVVGKAAEPARDGR